MATYVSNHASEAISEAWTDLENQQKAMYLVNASRTLDGLVDWIGDKYYSLQKMKWPRANAVVDGFLLESTIFPPQVVDATCEMAIWLMQNSGAVSVKQSDSYSQVRVGPIGIHFNNAMAQRSEEYFPDVVAILLKDLGKLNQPDLPGNNSLKLARLYRA